ncbi:molybdopterin synthase catalytic subunit [Diachasma alloeum]|uniref:molybdopterin synthase catalytic subunit n=1 Tax=Diachasma alloeum TaxID=454923 RepID=UPI00073845C7|nr:molybdopterin synthase catalytic subunit [Diachasma alloeum]
MEEQKSIVHLQKEKLNINDIIEAVTSPSCGAISTFIGTTRDNFESKKVLKLEYEAYEPMALKEMSNICKKIREQWNVQHIAIIHRLGEVPVSESSIAIAISSPHRQDSLQAVQFAIDTVKSSVPIWKKEVYDDQGAVWKENKECHKNVVIKSERLDVDDPGRNESDRSDRVKIDVDPSQVQVRASAEELRRRIGAFISRKREQNNMFNIQEFCSHRNLKDENESSCARVDAILIPRKDSKSHVKVHRVFNAHGPQTMKPSALQTSPEFPNTPETVNPVLDERLSSPEKFLGIEKPVPRDIYQRIKNIEDRIRYLESLSPEYKDFFTLGAVGGQDRPQKPVRKRTFSSAELDNKLVELEEKYAKKVR